MVNTFLALTLLGVAAAIIYGATRIRQLSFLNLVIFVLAVIIGLSTGALLGVPLGKLPTPYGEILPLAVSLMVTVAFVSVFLSQMNTLLSTLPFLRKLTHVRSGEVRNGHIAPVLVDTSVIIDGRIADIAKAGFVPGRLVVPRFVLAELQNIADSDEAMRRGRGRRGLEILNELRQVDGVETEISNEEVPDIKEVDAKLVHLAKKLGAGILTTDYNLNRVAQIEGVRVLNINELSNSIRPVVLPGENMAVKIVQAGKERGQGVGYLADGTMIVVDNGDKLIGQEINVEVTRVFQTVAGKMIFASPLKQPAVTSNGNGNGNGANSNNGRRHKVQRRNTNSNNPRQATNSLSAIEDRIVNNNQ